MTLSMHCEEPWFTKLKKGEKTVEGRKYSDRQGSINKGDRIVFHCGDDSFASEVTQKPVRYNNLGGFLRDNRESALPGLSIDEEGRRIDHQWNSDQDIADAGGFLAIHVKV